MESTMLLIGYFSDTIGIVGAVFSFGVWYLINRQNKKIQESISKLPPMEGFSEAVEYHSKVQTIAPFAVAISLIETGSIIADVTTFLAGKGGLFASMPVEEITMTEGLSPANMETFINELKKKKAYLNAANASEIHLFIAGPVQAGTICGMIFDNWKPVKLYHRNNKTKHYEYWCPLIKQ